MFRVIKIENFDILYFEGTILDIDEKFEMQKLFDKHKNLLKCLDISCVEKVSFDFWRFVQKENISLLAPKPWVLLDFSFNNLSFSTKLFLNFENFIQNKNRLVCRKLERLS